RVGLSLRSPAELKNTDEWSNGLYHFGYGLYRLNEVETYGTVRGGGPFWVSEYWSGSGVSFRNSAADGTEVAGGDSGGAAMRVYQSVFFQVGVVSQGEHDSDGVDVTVADAWPWLQEQLGWVYLRSVAYPGRRVGHGVAEKKRLVSTRANRADNWREKLTYDSVSKVIRAWNSSGPTDMCIDLRWNNPMPGEPFWWWPCDGGAAQRFTVNSDNQLELEGHPGRCLRETSDGYLRVANCSPDKDQTWVFDYDPGEY
ncbi:ricin-type beta-trefoil lectin domain protein, partial [Myxococcota bacterium]